MQLIFLCVFFLGAAVTGAARPNLVFLNADDLGWSDLGFMGSGYYETPHLDRLAAQGVVFTNAYAPAANCAPSRASVYTGQVTQRHGVLTVGDSARGNVRHRRLIPAPNRETLDAALTVFPELLQEAGYRTIHIGKWHVSEEPAKHGFDENIGGGKWGHPVHGYFSPYRIPGFEDGPDGEYLTERLAREACDVIRTHDASRPFFLSLQFYSPHTPIQARDEKIKHFKNKPATPHHSNPVYAAMISHLDDAVGEILAALEARGFLENTLVIFTSDNGGLHDLSKQVPLRGEKGAYYEGGIRVPLVIRWDGKTKPGVRHGIPVTGLDFFPTLLEAAGVAVPDGHALDGDSLIPMLTGSDTLPADRELVWHFPVYLQAYGHGNDTTRDRLFRTRPGSVIRVGEWKLHEYFEDGGLELYHLVNDPSERADVAAKHPEIARELLEKLQARRERTGAPMPLGPNPRFDAESESEAIRAMTR
ncbi:MAG: sulfatase [Luteolibacter sp.]